MAESVMKRTSRRTKSNARPQRARSGSGTAATQPRLSSTASTSGATAIANVMAQRAGMVQRMEYKPVGQIMQITTAAGVLEFRTGKGPAMGRLNDGTLDVVQPWPGLLPKIQSTEEMCPSCLAKCDECDGSGKHICSYGSAAQVCGGSGKVPDGEKPCACVKGKARPNPQCQKCGGRGAIAQFKKCAACDGSGKVSCPPCKGTGKMSTGYLKGAQRVRNQPEPPYCPECECMGVKLIRTPQDLAPHSQETDGVIYLGPIVRIMLKPYVETSQLANSIPALPQLWYASADSAGNHAYLVSLDKFAAGTRIALMGGIVVPGQ